MLVAAVAALAVVALQPGWAAGNGWGDLAGPLRGIAASAEAGGVVTSEAHALGVPLVRGQLLVEARFSGLANRGEVAEAGGDLVRAHGDLADVVIPASVLRKLAQLPDVTEVAPPSPLVPLQGYGAVVSQGVQLTNASVFYDNDVRGAGAKVAVIDTGFQDASTDTEIPISQSSTPPPSFRADGTMGVGDHGTAVAEIVADMAPQASIDLFAVDTPLSVVDALGYISSHNYQVACISLGILDGPFDDTHMVSKAVDAARAAGCLVVVAAGNFAQRHWEGDFTDRNNNGFNEFSTGVEGMSFTLAAAETFEAYLSWFETAGATTDQDYDLELFDTSGHMLASSAYAQNGDDPPSDTLIASLAAGTYLLKIRNISANGVAHFQLFVPFNDLPTALQVPEHSLSVPAVASGAMACGATRGSTIDTTPIGLPNLPLDTLEPFSSRGPTVDGRTKPDILGPDVVSTSFTANAVDASGEVLNPFVGTSAAAPHVAGAAALLYSENTQRTANDLATALTQMAYKYWKEPILADTPPKGMSVNQDDNYGWGRLFLRLATGFDNAPPTISVLFPNDGQTILTRVPTITASVTDAATGVDTDTIKVYLDGTAETGYTYDKQTGVLTYVVTTPLSTGAHSFTVSASDLAGNASGPVTITFQVVPPSIASGLQMVSLPYTNVANPDPASIFLPPVSGSIKVARWVPTDTQANKYHVYPDPWATLTPPDTQTSTPTVPSPPAGLGYFVTTPGVGTTLLNVQGGLVQSDSYTIQLYRGTTYPQGWNMIGNPYSSTVGWGSVEFVTAGVHQDLSDAIAAGVTPGILFEFKNNGQSTYYDFPANPLTSQMQPFKGYWVYVQKNTELIVYSPGIATSAATVKPQASWYGKGTWRLQLVADAGTWHDPTLYIGAGPGCTQGYDAGKDIPKPPPVATPLQTCVVEKNWGDHNGAYAQDLTSESNGASWDVQVMCQAANTKVTLTWPNLNAIVPSNVKLVLEDPASGKSVYMRTTGSYTFNSGAGGVRNLTVQATEDDSHTLQITGVSTQAAMGRGAVVTFSVTQACQAEVQVRNISGVVVKDLGSVNADSGKAVTLQWNGLSDTGSPVPAGRYLVCVTARASDGQSVQGVRSLQIGR